MPDGPLAGTRVVDLTRVWAGPLATRILGDLGAEVIKVEAATGRGPRRPASDGQGHYPDGDPGVRPWNRQGSFNKLNRNKQSVVLDLKSTAGRDLFLRLVAECDAVVENFSAGTMDDLDLGYDVLRRANPDVVYVSMPGFGSTGPYRDYVAFGPSIEPMTGLTSLMGYGDGQPRVTAIALPDAMAGTTGAMAVVTALWRRRATGRGAHVDISQHEASIGFIGEYFLERQIAGAPPEAIGNRHARFVPHGVYRCAGEDRWTVIAARSEAEWSALCAAAARGWDADPRFADASARRAHEDALDAAIEAWTSTLTQQQLSDLLRARRVPCGAVLDAPGLLADPHLRERGFFVELEQPDLGPRPYPGTGVLIDGRRNEGWIPAPSLGQHNEEILGGMLGLGDDEIAALYRDGVIATQPPA